MKNKPNIMAEMTITVWAGPFNELTMHEHRCLKAIMPADFGSRTDGDRIRYFIKHADRFLMMMLARLSAEKSPSEAMLLDYLKNRPKEVGLHVFIHNYDDHYSLPSDIGNNLKNISVEG